MKFSDPKEYLFFNRRESKQSLLGEKDGRKVSNDLDFLNALNSNSVKKISVVKVRFTLYPIFTNINFEILGKRAT